jgi:phosphotransferase system enzyme I (PtsP)
VKRANAFAPINEVIVAFQGKQALLAQRVARFAAIRGEPAVTRDGVRISLNMNAGLLLDLPHLAQSGADGIGLFRTELQFMIGSNMPRLKAQIEFYRQMFDAALGKPVVFRTLDLGGDKVPSYGRTVRGKIGARLAPAYRARSPGLLLSVRALIRRQWAAPASASPMVSGSPNSKAHADRRELERPPRRIAAARRYRAWRHGGSSLAFV